MQEQREAVSNRIESARQTVQKRLEGNVAQASNKAFLRAITTLSAAGESLADDAVQLAQQLQGTADVPEDGECEWCGVPIAECEKYDHGEDAEGCPGPEIRVLRARNLRLHSELVEHRKLMTHAILGLRTGGDTGTAAQIEEKMKKLTDAATSLPRQRFDQVQTRTTKNAISILHEYATRTRKGAPEFKFVQTGSAHIPTIHCWCSFDGLTGEGIDHNKQDAKLQAAQRVLEQIQARRG